MSNQQSNPSTQNGPHHQAPLGPPSPTTSSAQWSTTAQCGSPTPPPKVTHKSPTKKEHKVKDTEHDLRGIGSWLTKYVFLTFCTYLSLVCPFAVMAHDLTGDP